MELNLVIVLSFGAGIVMGYLFGRFSPERSHDERQKSQKTKKSGKARKSG